GFLRAGLTLAHATTGIVLVFRDTDFLKQEIQYEKQLAANISPEELGSALKIKRLKVERTEGAIYHFKEGTYNSTTGEAIYSQKKLPYVMDKMTHLHKAKSADPRYALNIFFGVALPFFVVSSFWMFMPHTDIFKKGLYFTLGGIVLTLVLLFV
ncbi:MAG: hypothetical protein AAGJ93_14060, partial [Bacteroidota bacterium]